MPNRNVIAGSDEQSRAAFSAVGTILGGYEPGYELIGESHPNAIERFVVVCVRGAPRLLLPAKTPVMRTAISSFLGRRQFVKLVPPFINIASRAGGPFSRIVSEVSLISQTGAVSPLRTLIADVIGRNDFHIAMRLSFGRPNAKTVALAISDAGEELCFAKFGSESMTNDLVAHESAILEQFEGVDMPMIVPRRLYSGTWADDHNVLITEPLKLSSLDRDARSAHQAADAFASQNLVANAALGDSDYWHQVVEQIKKFGLRENGNDSLIKATQQIENVWGDCNFDFGASHGDWSRANVGIVDGRVAALDWERCTKLAPRGIDIAHFAICESLFRPHQIERAAECVRQYQRSAGLRSGNAEILVMLASLEMVIRFKSVQHIEFRSADSKFESAIQSGLRKWAV
jgi:hypothetical protein